MVQCSASLLFSFCCNTLGLVFLATSTSAAMARCRFSGTLTASTLSTCTPHGMVALSSADYKPRYILLTSILWAMDSLTDRISPIIHIGHSTGSILHHMMALT